MSGLTKWGTYELTHTKGFFWHKRRGCCTSLLDIGNHHLSAFEWQLGRGGNFLVIQPPEESAIYAAVSGPTRGTTRTK